MTFEEDCMKMFKVSLNQLKRATEVDAPKIILAVITTSLILAAEGAFGKDLYEELLKRRLGSYRQSMGYCNLCDNNISAELSYKPICDSCENIIEKELDELENRHMR